MINTELSLLLDVYKDGGAVNNELEKLKKELKIVNEKLWDIEDNIRLCEKEKDFGERFIELARAVYFTNDRRSEVKGCINQLVESSFGEVKSYEDYT